MYKETLYDRRCGWTPGGPSMSVTSKLVNHCFMRYLLIYTELNIISKRRGSLFLGSSIYQVHFRLGR